MRRFTLFIGLVMIALLGWAMLAYASPHTSQTAVAKQHPIGGSQIHGRVHFTDDGSTLTVDGTATGLSPNIPYFSLLYTLGTDPGGVSEHRSQPRTSKALPACSDLNRAGNSTIDANQMVVGFWQNKNDGTGTLHAVKTSIGNSQDPLFQSIPGVAEALESFGYVFGANSYSPIGQWRTVSIRDASNNFNLVACGEVHAG